MAENGSDPVKQKPVAKKSSGRKKRTFPADSFENSLEIAETIQRIGGGTSVRRLTLFDDLGRSPDSGTSRQQITNSGKYGLTTGSYAAEMLALTPDGALATSADASPRERLRARFNLAIDQIEPFKGLYEKFVGQKLPTPAVMQDYLREIQVAEPDLSECVDTFIVNAKFVGVLKTVAGAERLLPLDHVLDELPSSTSLSGGHAAVIATIGSSDTGSKALDASESRDWDAVCFYVTPIGAEESDERRHSDVILSAVVEPALAELGLTVVRADHIGESGMITSQVIEHLTRSKLVVADLSFGNPNVFYELALRHALNLPAVQVIRTQDRIPFDLDQVRTVKMDMTSLYDFVPQMGVYRAELTSQARHALDGGIGSSPITAFYPEFWAQSKLA